MEQQNENALEKVNSWMKNSLMLKLITVTILILLLLIPTSMIKSIINEREMLSESARIEVSRKWANAQTITGPILTVPAYYEYEEITDEKRIRKTYTKDIHILPRKLDINGQVSPESLKRGIYEVVVYESKLDVSGSFNLEDVQINEKDLKEIRWSEAQISIGISDLRGIRNKLEVSVNGEPNTVKPGTTSDFITPSGVSTKVDLSGIISKPIAFKFKLDLQGSENISFVPLGSTTNVNLKSPWASPSFNGNFIPKERDVSDSGFIASWQVLELNRSYPEWWIGEDHKLAIKASEFGTDLILPMDDYQKSMRSAKYAIMTIGLTFLIFFMLEIINKKKIHPFQYALVGLSLSIFYVLLVSLSEHIAFNLAYLLSMVAIVGMISAYSLSVFRKKSQTMMLSGIMTAFYGFMFVTLQLTDYALLLGSLGLVVILGLTMYFTRNINWYGLKFSPQ